MEQIKIALAGNPNSGKTTLFNALTGANQFVGNWPGVTVEKKEGKLKKHDDVTIMDLPGIYSLSPYTLEEVVARNYLIDQRPDAILNIIDGTNLERNLYLTTQLTELGIPTVISMMVDDGVMQQDKVYLLRMGGLIAVMSVVGVLGTILLGYCCARISTAVTCDIRNDLFEKVQTLSHQEMNQMGVSSLITRTSNDALQIMNF